MSFTSAFLWLLAANSSAWDEFVVRYRSAADSDRFEMALRLIEQQKTRGGFPLLEGNDTAVVVFFGSGVEEDVRVLGDFKTRHPCSVYWDDRGEPLERLAPGSHVYFRKMKLEPDARLDYKFLVDGELKLDANNPRVGSGRPVGDVSELAMPGFSQPAAIKPRDPPGGSLKLLNEAWANPKVQLYLPPGYDSKQRYPVVYTADGSGWLKEASLAAVLDNLIADGSLQPLIAVMIDPAADRSDWYSLNPNYFAYLDRVVDWVDAHYSTIAQASGRLHIGSSAGARAAFFAALERPKSFGNVALFSPGLYGPGHYLEPLFTGRKKLPRGLKVWMSSGTYEKCIAQDAHTLSALFKRNKLKAHSVHTHEGHSWGTWRHLLPEALVYFFGTTKP